MVNSYLFNIANYSSSAEGYVLKLGVESKYEGKTAILKYRTDAGEWITISTQTVSNSEIAVSITNWSNYYYLTFTQNTSEETKEETKENLSNSPLYATLYTDGTLAFSNDNSIISGKTMNEYYNLSGKNAYKDELTIVSIPLNQLNNIDKLAIARFEVGARWFDDIVDNNRNREVGV